MKFKKKDKQTKKKSLKMDDELIVSIVFQVLLYIYIVAYLVIRNFFADIPLNKNRYWHMATFIIFVILGLINIILSGLG